MWYKIEIYFEYAPIAQTIIKNVGKINNSFSKLHFVLYETIVEFKQVWHYFRA